MGETRLDGDRYGLLGWECTLGGLAWFWMTWMVQVTGRLGRGLARGLCVMELTALFGRFRRSGDVPCLPMITLTCEQK